MVKCLVPIFGGKDESPDSASVASKDAVTATRRKQCAGNGLALGICDGLVVGKPDSKITTTRKGRLERKWTLKLVKPDFLAGSGCEKFHARSFWANHGYTRIRPHYERRECGSLTLSYGEGTCLGKLGQPLKGCDLLTADPALPNTACSNRERRRAAEKLARPGSLGANEPGRAGCAGLRKLDCQRDRAGCFLRRCVR